MTSWATYDSSHVELTWDALTIRIFINAESAVNTDFFLTGREPKGVQKQRPKVKESCVHISHPPITLTLTNFKVGGVVFVCVNHVEQSGS